MHPSPNHAGISLVLRLRPIVGSGLPRSAACGTPAPSDSDSARPAPDQPRFVGPAPARVRGLRGWLAPAAPSESDSGSARPAPDQPRSGLTAQSWVRLRPRPAVVLMCSPSVRLGLDLPGSRSSKTWLEAQSWVRLRQVSSVCQWGLLAPAPSDSDSDSARLWISHVLA
jgi:hypothetical protein